MWGIKKEQNLEYYPPKIKEILWEFSLEKKNLYIYIYKPCI